MSILWERRSPRFDQEVKSLEHLYAIVLWRAFSYSFARPVRKGWRLDKKKENDEFIGSLVAEGSSSVGKKKDKQIFTAYTHAGESLIAPLNKVASPSKDYGSCFFLQLLSLAFVQKSTAPHQLT
jgi:hypothetical protein